MPRPDSSSRCISSLALQRARAARSPVRARWGPADRGCARPSAAGADTRPPGSGMRSAAQSHAINPVTPVVIPAMMASVEEVEVVVAHNERATLRVGDVFLKIDADQARTDVEAEAMAMAPIPTPEVLWRKPPALALAPLPGTALAPPRRAICRVAGRVGRGGCRRTDAARRAAAAMARPQPRRARIPPRRRMRGARRPPRPSRP